MDFDVAFESLFKMVSLAVVLAIMGISYGMKAVLVTLLKLRNPEAKPEEIKESVERFMPAVVMMLGAGAAFIFTPATHNWRIWAMAAVYYAGAADLFYTLIWQTILNKLNLMELVSNLLLKWKGRNL